MKRAIYFITIGAFLILTGCSKSDADFPNDEITLGQQESVHSRTDQTEVKEDTYNTPIICNGVIVDYLQGLIKSQWQIHYENGLRQWIVINFNGTLESGNGEILTLEQSDKLDFVNGHLYEYPIQLNIEGENGNHYICSGHINLKTGEVVAEKTECHCTE